MAAEIRASGKRFEAGIPKELFEVPLATRRFLNFVVSADGQGFLLPLQVERQAATPITILLNWSGRQK